MRGGRLFLHQFADAVGEGHRVFDGQPFDKQGLVVQKAGIGFYPVLFGWVGVQGLELPEHRVAGVDL